MVNDDLQHTFVRTSMQQIAAHYNYAKILSGTKNPPDAADIAHAKDVLRDGFNNVPKGVYDQVKQTPEVQSLAKTVGLGDKPAAAAGGDKPPAAGAAPAGGEKGLAGLSPEQLDAQLIAAQDKGAAGMKEAKALFEEAIRRAEEPTKIKIVNDGLKANLTALETGKDADGKPLDADARAELHIENAEGHTISRDPHPLICIAQCMLCDLGRQEARW